MKNTQKKKEKLRTLIDLIKDWDFNYYMLDNPIVSDFHYDEKFKELKKIEKDLNFTFDDSPSLESSLDIKKNSKLSFVKRKNPMLSIDSINDYEELFKFDKRVQKEIGKKVDYVCELKIDGLSVSVIYQKGEIKQITTRGDGFLGEEVTNNKNLVIDLPTNNKILNGCEVRGEVYMKKDEFKKVNSDLVENKIRKLSNPRNAAAGSLRTISFKSVRRRNLNFFPYQVLPKNSFENQVECLEFLKKNGFKIPHYKSCSNVEGIKNFIEEVKERRESLDFPIDGVVIKVNDYGYCSILGETNRFPKWSIAYKFSASESKTTIREIKSEVSKNGRISYIAIVDPVNIGGSVIKNATLHNRSFIEKNSINIFDEVIIKRAGDVVPQISRIYKKNSESFWEPDTKCPSCLQDLFWNEKNVYQFCRNYYCYEKIISYLSFFVSKSAFDIKGISKNTIKKMFDRNLVKKPSDFYKLKYEEDELKKIFKDKTRKNILSSIEKSRFQKLDKIISSFSIPLLSTYKAKELSKFFSENASFLVDFIKKEDFIEIEKLLGKKTSDSFRVFFSHEKNIKDLEELSAQMNIS